MTFYMMFSEIILEDCKGKETKTREVLIPIDGHSFRETYEANRRPRSCVEVLDKNGVRVMLVTEKMREISDRLYRESQNRRSTEVCVRLDGSADLRHEVGPSTVRNPWNWDERILVSDIVEKWFKEKTGG